MKTLLAQYCCVGVLGVLFCAPANGQLNDVPQPPQHEVAQTLLNEFAAEIQTQGNWSEYSRLLDSMVDHLWDDNRWHSEADTFAREMAHEVSRIPPWQFSDRMKKVIDVVGDRYDFTPEQRLQLQSELTREAFGFMVHNAKALAQVGSEFFGTRARGDPFSAEQIARWSEDGNPVMGDLKLRVDRLVERNRDKLNARQRGILDRDHKRFSRRANDLQRKFATWSRGEWTPAEWGLQDDPMHVRRRRQLRAAAEHAGTGQRAPRPVRKLGSSWGAKMPQDESTWAVYVQGFIQRHNLDAGQRTTIHSILAELQTRARHRRERLANSDAASRSSGDDDGMDTQSLFQELKLRSEALLTGRQRSEHNIRKGG